MGQNQSLVWVLDSAERKFGQQTQEVHAALTGELNMMVDRLTRRYNFWFMSVLPDTVPAFPITTLDSSTTCSFERWYSRGWLLVVPDRYRYMYAVPLGAVISDIGESSPTRWTYAEVANLESASYYNKQGMLQQELQIVPNTEFYRWANLNTSGRPLHITAQTVLDGCSELIISPKPSEYALLQIAARLATLPPLDTPRSTHAMLTYFPHVVERLACLALAEYFHQDQAVMQYARDLYGMAYLQQDNPNMLPGGMIGEMIADSRNKSNQKHMTTKIYSSAADALGRKGVTRRSLLGRYYVQP